MRDLRNPGTIGIHREQLVVPRHLAFENNLLSVRRRERLARVDVRQMVGERWLLRLRPCE